MNDKSKRLSGHDEPQELTQELLDQVEKAIDKGAIEDWRADPRSGPRELTATNKHPTIEHGEALAKHLETVMADYSKRVATAADLIRRTVEQLAEDQTKIEKHLDLITKGCQDIGKIGSQR